MSSAGDALVRPATLADARAMAEVHVRSYRRFYRGILPNEALTRHSVDDRYAEWRQVIEEGIGASRAAIVDDRIVGVCFAHNEPQDRDLP